MYNAVVDNGLLLITMTKGQMEDAIAKDLTHFYAETLGVGPRQAKTYITRDMVIVRLKGNTHPYEHVLLKQNRGVELVKNLRTAVLESVVDDLTSLVEKHTGAKVVTVHSDSSTRTGERFVIFVLDTQVG